MKTPSFISAAGREEFEKEFTFASFTWNGDNATGTLFAKQSMRKIKSHILSQEVKILESVKEWVENNKAFDYINRADLQSFLEEEIKKIIEE